MSAVVVTTEELKTACVEHPRFKARVLPNELEESVSPDTVRQYYDAIGDAIELEKGDPLRYGFEPEVWKKADEELRKFQSERTSGRCADIRGAGRDSVEQNRVAFQAHGGEHAGLERLQGVGVAFHPGKFAGSATEQD
jgi:hypothetical protein